MYSHGTSAYLYQLLQLRREQIELYRALFHSVPAPFRMTPTTDTNFPYLPALAVIILVLGSVSFWYFSRGKPGRD
jgi:hypothetical protein